jgi:predicted amidophosphoribosyltransferase
VLGAIVDLLFPHRCPACDALAGRSAGFCTRCAAALVPVPPAACPVCGVPTGGDGPPLVCADCRVHRPPFLRAASAFLFGGPLADAVGRFKAGGIPEFPRVVAPALATVVRRMLRHDPGAPACGLAVAVPPDPARLARRGFDPGTQIGAAAAHALGLPLRPGLLASGPRPHPQRELPREDRLRALRGAFRLTARGAAAVAGRHVLLLDDVRTTGSTVTACARVLRSGGAASFRVATLALVE